VPTVQEAGWITGRVCRKEKSLEIFALLGCYATFICSYRRFGTTYRSHLQRSYWSAWYL